MLIYIMSPTVTYKLVIIIIFEKRYKNIKIKKVSKSKVPKGDR